MSDALFDDDVTFDPKVETRLNQTARTLTLTATEAARRELQEKVKRYLEAGGKITKVESGYTGFVKASAVYTEHSVKAAAKKNRAGRGRFTERQKKILDHIIDAMNGERTITIESLHKTMQGKPDNLKQTLRVLSRKGFLKWDGETITKGFVA